MRRSQFMLILTERPSPLSSSASGRTFFFSSRSRHTSSLCDWSSDVCSSDLAQIFERYGATVRRIDVEWGRAVDPQRLRDELRREGADVVGMVHAETSTGVRNPIKELAAIARESGALTIVDM